MKDANIKLIEKHTDILTFRELADSTISAYKSYLTQFIEWIEKNHPNTEISDATWEQVRDYINYLRHDRKLALDRSTVTSPSFTIFSIMSSGATVFMQNGYARNRSPEYPSRPW